MPRRGAAVCYGQVAQLAHLALSATPVQICTDEKFSHIRSRRATGRRTLLTQAWRHGRYRWLQQEVHEHRMPEHAQVIRIARYRADPGARDQMLAVMQQLASVMRELPGLFGAQVCAVAGTDDWVAVVSRWRDEASMRDIAGTRAAELTQELAGLADEEVLEHLVAIGSQPAPTG